jgi:methyltransferase (TIGR00027 family)
VLREARAVARCERITVAVDLREDWPNALAAAGHDPAVPTTWIAEGLLIYLPEEAMELLLARIGAQSATRSRMGLTLGSRGVIERFGADAAPGWAASMWCRRCPTTRWACRPGTAGRPAATPCASALPLTAARSAHRRSPRSGRAD